MDFFDYLLFTGLILTGVFIAAPLFFALGRRSMYLDCEEFFPETDEWDEILEEKQCR